jgi:hypothetical protein
LWDDLDPRVIRPSKSQEWNSEYYGEREPEDDGLLSGVHEEPIYGLRYEEMVLIDKEKLVVL